MAPPADRLTATVIVPTYERPAELKRCLASLAAQTRPPEELLVIDDGRLDAVPCREALEAAGVRVTLRRKQTPGVTESRNLGLDLASGDIVFLSEDDVVLFPDYVERIMAVFEADAEETIAGVGGLIDNERRGRLAGVLRLVLYTLLGLTALHEGRLTRSGFAGEYGESLLPIRQLGEVDFLLGGVAAYRRSHIDAIRFSSRYRMASGYGQGEDKDFSVRVARVGRLVVEPRARLEHHPATKHNFDPYMRGRGFTLFLDTFHREHLRQRPWHALAFYYSLTGYTLLRLVLLLARPGRGEWFRVRGIFAGWHAILTGEARTHL